MTSTTLTCFTTEIETRFGVDFRYHRYFNQPIDTPYNDMVAEHHTTLTDKECDELTIQERDEMEELIGKDWEERYGREKK